MACNDRMVVAAKFCSDFYARNPGLILFARFDDAPSVLQALSDEGGDEDWIIVLPVDHPALDGGSPWWIERMDTGSNPVVIDLPVAGHHREAGQQFRVFICCH